MHNDEDEGDKVKHANATIPDISSPNPSFSLKPSHTKDEIGKETDKNLVSPSVLGQTENNGEQTADKEEQTSDHKAQRADEEQQTHTEMPT